MEAKARELAEHLRAESHRRASTYTEFDNGVDIPEDDFINVRWPLTCKALPAEPPGSRGDRRKQDTIDGFTTIREDGTAKAKARIFLLGFNHPDLVVRDLRNEKVSKTALPTISRRGDICFVSW